MVRYYCSGYDINNAFGHGLGDMFRGWIERNKKHSIYPRGGTEKIEKIQTKYLPAFTKHFEDVGIKFDEVTLITPDIDKSKAQEKVKKMQILLC